MSVCCRGLTTNKKALLRKSNKVRKNKRKRLLDQRVFTIRPEGILNILLVR